MDRLAEDDLRITPTQLERWRQLGLIPRAQILRPTFGGSAVVEHDEDVLMSCAILAQASTRGRPWQYAAIELFEQGQTLSTAAVRNAASFLLDRQLSGFQRAWNDAEVGADRTGTDPGEWVADVATEAARYAGRMNRRLVREEVALANPHMSQPQLREAAHTALVWRIADINVPTLLTPQQQQWARTGSDDPPDPLRSIPVPLPSERAACVATLTWAEAALARWQLQVYDLVGEDVPLLTMATWRVVTLRLDEDYRHPERPLSSEILMRIRNSTIEDLDENERDAAAESQSATEGAYADRRKEAPGETSDLGESE